MDIHNDLKLKCYKNIPSALANTLINTTIRDKILLILREMNI